jgi:ethanolamine permease
VLLGIARILSCHAKFWNFGLQMGIYPFLAANWFHFIGYLCLCLCLADMGTALPFTGGSYGIVRGILSPFLGFYVGFMEITANISNVGGMMIGIGEAFTLAGELSFYYEPLFWILPILLCYGITFSTRKVFWTATSFLSISGIIILLIYIFGSISFINTQEYFQHKDIVATGLPTTQAKKFFSYLSFPTYFYVGIELLPVVSHEAKNVCILFYLYFIILF